jgi:hypothetical protein
VHRMWRELVKARVLAFGPVCVRAPHPQERREGRTRTHPNTDWMLPPSLAPKPKPDSHTNQQARAAASSSSPLCFGIRVGKGAATLRLSCPALRWVPPSISYPTNDSRPPQRQRVASRSARSIFCGERRAGAFEEAKRRQNDKGAVAASEPKEARHRGRQREKRAPLYCVL